MLIIPISHGENLGQLSDTNLTEMEKYKLSLKLFFAAQDKSVVFFERNIHDRRFPSQHCHIQVELQGFTISDRSRQSQFPTLSMKRQRELLRLKVLKLVYIFKW